ncbi:MAG TPA: Error-prone repair protein ImuA [Chitinophagaceae bacterium]
MQKDLLFLQGVHSPKRGEPATFGLGAIESAFPHQRFPTGGVHDFLTTSVESAAATTGFIAALLGRMIKDHGVAVWISRKQSVFPPGLVAYGIDPHRILFMDLPNQNERLWAMEESLKTAGLAVVVGETPGLNFIESRRFQLAVESSRVTAFVIRPSQKSPERIACLAQWKVTSIPSEFEAGINVIGFPRWNIELLKARNGKPGKWMIEWNKDRFTHILPETTSAGILERKTG